MRDLTAVAPLAANDGSLDTAPFEPVGASAGRVVARLKQKLADLRADGAELAPRPVLSIGRASPLFQNWKREPDLNRRPSAYEADELARLLYPADEFAKC